jgi:hypothetical protein
MVSRYYAYAGLLVASEIPLPEWSPFEVAEHAGDPDVVISVEEDPSDPDFPPGGDRRVITAGEHRFRVPGVGYFRVHKGREIVVAPARGVALHQLRPWLLGSAWGSLCYQRGLFLIHASAVLVGAEAVLFCARAKGGKSTMAAQLHTMGHPLLSDDLGNLDIPADGPPTLYPSAPRLKLWSDTLDELGWSIEHLEPDHTRAGKFHVMRTANNFVRPAPVRGIYLLEWGELGMRRLSGLTALRRFLSASIYRTGLLESAGRLAQHSRGSITLLQRVPVWEVRRPRDLSAMGKTADLLAGHWSGDLIMDR